MKKILVIHASAGAGHTRAAEAVYQGIKEKTDYNVALANVLDFTPPLYKKMYQDGYAFVVSRLPWLWAAFFNLWDVPWLQGIIRTFRRDSNNLMTKELMKYLEREQFDWIISTHFLPNEVAGFLKTKGLIQSKIISVVTDFDVHRIWLAEGVDFYTVASPSTEAKVRQLGILKEEIVVTGIPTDSKFTKKKNREEICSKHSMNKDAFTVLLVTGSFGMGPIEKILNLLKDFQVLVVCGRNERLFCKLYPRSHGRLHVFGFTSDIDELMAVSNVIVTKPGGLSISESLISGLPILFFTAIPGQEINNVRILNKYGIGFYSKNMEEIAAEIKKLSENPNYHQEKKENLAQLASPFAVSDIINLIQ